MFYATVGAYDLPDYFLGQWDEGNDVLRITLTNAKVGDGNQGMVRSFHTIRKHFHVISSFSNYNHFLCEMFHLYAKTHYAKAFIIKFQKYSNTYTYVYNSILCRLDNHRISAEKNIKLLPLQDINDLFRTRNEEAEK